MTGGLGFGKPKDGKLSGKNSRQFFETVLDAAGTGNQERVYRLLDENEDKLNDNFAQLVREDAEVKLRKLNPRQRGNCRGIKRYNNFSAWKPCHSVDSYKERLNNLSIIVEPS